MNVLQGARLDDIHLWMADGYATLTQLVLVTPDCAFRGGTSVNFRQNVNKLGFTQDLPLIGGFFAPTPRQGQLTQANQIGLAYWPTEANFVLVNIGPAHKEFAAAMREQSILVRDRYADPGCDGLVRITIGTRKQMHLAITAIQNWKSVGGLA